MNEQLHNMDVELDEEMVDEMYEVTDEQQCEGFVPIVKGGVRKVVQNSRKRNKKYRDQAKVFASERSELASRHREVLFAMKRDHRVVCSKEVGQLCKDSAGYVAYKTGESLTLFVLTRKLLTLFLVMGCVAGIMIYYNPAYIYSVSKMVEQSLSKVTVSQSLVSNHVTPDYQISQINPGLFILKNEVKKFSDGKGLKGGWRYFEINKGDTLFQMVKNQGGNWAITRMFYQVLGTDVDQLHPGEDVAIYFGKEVN